MDPVIIVGAGLSGIAAARTLLAAGLETVVLDRGRRIAGRMAVRTTDDRPVDIGASYFTVSDPSFAAVVDDWHSRGLARPWTDTFHVYDAGTLTPKSGPVRWAAPAGLRSLIEDLAADVDVRQETVTTIEQTDHGVTVDGTAAPAVLLAMPDPQARRLLAPGLETLASALDDPFEPVLALTVRWDDRAWPDDLDGVFVSGDPSISWIADDGRRRGDGAPVLVAHSTPELARAHLENPQGAAPTMTAAVQKVLSITEPPTTTHVHRWTFARPASTRSVTYVLDPALVGVCGDAWSDRPRVEAAYLSGVALATAVRDLLVI